MQITTNDVLYYTELLKLSILKISSHTAGSIGRKRPLLCSTINNITNPTKRTVMTLLARAKAANALHGFHPNGPSITE